MLGVLTISGGDDSHLVPPQCQLSQNVHTIGRGTSHRTDFLNIKQPYVSGKHFCIERQVTAGISGISAKFVLTDMSTNGTYVNGVQLGKSNHLVIKDGDVISIKFKEENKIMYTFNAVDDIEKVRNILPLADEDSKPGQIQGALHSDAEFESLTKQLELLHREMEEQEGRFASVLSKKEVLTRDLAAAQRELASATERHEVLTGQMKEMSERILELEAHNAMVEARCRIQEEHSNILKGQLEAQKAKSSIGVEVELQLEEYKAKNASLHDEIFRKNAQADARQKLLDEANAHATKEAEARMVAESHLAKLRNALKTINTDLHASEIQKSSSTLALADAGRRLALLTVSDRNLRNLLLRSERVILAQREMVSKLVCGMRATYRNLGSLLTPLPFQFDGQDDAKEGYALAISNFDSQIDGLRSNGEDIDMTSYQSLLMVVESEVIPHEPSREFNAETCADSMLTSRMLSIRSAGGDDAAPLTIQLSEGGRYEFEETQPQDPLCVSPQYATQAPDMDGEQAAQSSDRPYICASPSAFMSPVTTAPNSAASAVPSGVKIRYRRDVFEQEKESKGSGLICDMRKQLSDTAESGSKRQFNGSQNSQGGDYVSGSEDSRPLKVAKKP